MTSTPDTGPIKLCTRCKNPKPLSDFYAVSKTNSKLRAACKQCANGATMDRWRELHRSPGICRLCTKPATHGALCAQHRAYTKTRYRQKPALFRAYRIKSRNKLKDLVFAHYGGATCACCKETTYEFLTIDHIENNGNKQPRNERKSLYSWLKTHNFPSGFQVLCMNCNWAKGKYGHCPHER